MSTFVCFVSSCEMCSHRLGGSLALHISYHFVVAGFSLRKEIQHTFSDTRYGLRYSLAGSGSLLLRDGFTQKNLDTTLLCCLTQQFVLSGKR